MKKTAIILIIALALALATFACDDKGDNTTNDDNEVKERTATRTLSGGIGSVTIKGNFTKSGMETTADKVASGINTKYNADNVSWGGTLAFDYYKGILDNGVTYIVETNPVGYTKFKTIGDSKTVYIALDIADTAIAGEALYAIGVQEIGKATPTANKGEETT